VHASLLIAEHRLLLQHLILHLFDLLLELGKLLLTQLDGFFVFLLRKGLDALLQLHVIVVQPLAEAHLVNKVALYFDLEPVQTVNTPSGERVCRLSQSVPLNRVNLDTDVGQLALNLFEARKGRIFETRDDTLNLL